MRRAAWALAFLILGAASPALPENYRVYPSDENIDLPDFVQKLHSDQEEPPQVRAELAWFSNFDRPSGINLSFDADMPTAVIAQVLEDLDFMRRIRGTGASRLHQQIFGPVDGAAYLGFFQTRIKTVGLGMGDDPSTIAFVSADQDAHKMWFTPSYLASRLPRIERVAILIHEARHTEKVRNHWAHPDCPAPFLDSAGHNVRGIFTGTLMAGLDACDDSPYGPYAIEAILLKNIQKYCSNCTNAVKMEAGFYGDDILKRIIDPKARQDIQDDLYQR